MAARATIERVQHLSLDVERGLRRVEVLGLFPGEGAAAEGHDASLAYRGWGRAAGRGSDRRSRAPVWRGSTRPAWTSSVVADAVGAHAARAARPTRRAHSRARSAGRPRDRRRACRGTRAPWRRPAPRAIGCRTRRPAAIARRSASSLPAASGSASRAAASSTPVRSASARTASGKARRSWRMRKPKASPPAPQPKQWKMPRLGFTVNDGVFSVWKGHRPFQFSPARLRFTTWPTSSTMSTRARMSSRTCGAESRHQETRRGAPPPPIPPRMACEPGCGLGPRREASIGRLRRRSRRSNRDQMTRAVLQITRIVAPWAIRTGRGRPRWRRRRLRTTRPGDASATSGCALSTSSTARRRAPVPLPWMMRTDGSPARKASSRYFSSRSRASSVVFPIRRSSPATLLLSGICHAAPRAAGRWPRGRAIGPPGRGRCTPHGLHRHLHRHRARPHRGRAAVHRQRSLP